jgi:phospholipase C
VIQFLEKWTSALGKPALSPNISAWRRKVCGDLTAAFDFASPVYGLPHLPATGLLIPEVEYDPQPGDNRMPVQEPGTRRARPLPFQPNANLTGFAGGVAKLAFSNVAPFATRASHFAVYDNRAGVPSLTQYPAAFPSQFTVAANKTAAGSGPVDGTAYDLTVVGPNRFLRRFIGDTATAGRDLRVEASYYEGHSHSEPKLHLTLANDGHAPVAFTITHHQYVHGHPQTVKVAGRSSTTWTVDALSLSHGWYDLTVTAGSDHAWSQRFTGHLETGKPSISG